MTERYINNRSCVGLVDEDTGEIFQTVGVGDQIRIIRKSSIESFKRISEETVSVNSGRDFVKQFPDISEKLCKLLIPVELWTLNFLIPYVGINSGILKTVSGEFITREYMLEKCKGVVSRSTIDRSLAGLVGKGVLAKCYIKNKKCYIMNPFVCHRGSKANETLLGLFQHSGWGGRS